MSRPIVFIASVSAAFLFLPFAARAAEAAKPGFVSIDPAKVDADFAFQGEYTGEVGGKKTGLQVIAMGGGKFRAVVLAGGLPGDGWEKGNRDEADGELHDGAAVFAHAKWKVSVKDGAAKITATEGGAGELKRVARKSPTLGQKPPTGAVVLFDGTSAENFQGGKMSAEGFLQEGCTSRQKFQGQVLHVEFMLPYMPYARGQGRGNSGVYSQGRYEAQVLDSFGLLGKMNETGGIYSIKDPDLNMCFPPLTWQTYDIDFTAGGFDAAGKKTRNPKMTVRLNGVVVQQDVELPHTTTAAPVKEGPEPGPLYLQNHGNPVRFRNIWVLEKK
jgi:hypothetical protein